MPEERRRWIWVAAVATACGGAAGLAAELRPSWECLPAETGLMIRLPGAATFLEALRGTTRMGAVVLRPDRLDGLGRLLLEQADAAGGESEADGVEDWEESLKRYGLETADLLAAFRGDAGVALVVRPREGLPPLRMLVAWAEPGEEVAGRLLAAAKQRLEEAAAGTGGGPAPRRIDLELAGHEVVSSVVPVMGLDMSAVDFEGVAAGGEEDDAGQAARLERLRERLREAKPVQTGQTHAFHAVLGGRFLYAATFPTILAGPAGGDPAATSGGDEAREIFASFLAAHGQDDESPLARVLREPVLAAAAPAGTPLLEVVVVPRTFMAAIATHDDAAAARLAQLGLDEIGGIAWRQSLEAGRWRSSIAATVPAPRRGILAVLDQPCDACDVPPFVTREAVSFTQISLDLGKAFGTLRDTLLAAGDADQLSNMLNVADVQSTTWLGADVATVLSGLGSRHWLITFPTRIGEAIAEARRAGAAGLGGELAGADSLALVWRVADENPLLKLLGRLAPLAGGQLQEEQGFRGLRLPGGGAAFVGRNHFVLAVGKDTLEKVLAGIRNPPSGEVSWRESDALRRAGQLVDMPPARMFGLSDATRTGGTLGTLREILAALEPADVPTATRELLAAGQKLLPMAAEMEGLFGVGATVLRMTDEGLRLESAWDLPAP